MFNTRQGRAENWANEKRNESLLPRPTAADDSVYKGHKIHLRMGGYQGGYEVVISGPEVNGTWTGSDTKQLTTKIAQQEIDKKVK